MASVMRKKKRRPIRRGWTDEELSASVVAYGKMLRYQAENRPYSKKVFYKALKARFGRTEKAFEYRMQNISSVLDSLHRPWVPGLRPAGHVGTKIAARIVRLLKVQDRAGGSYEEKIPEMRAWLIEVARQERKVTYREMMEVFDLNRSNLHRALAVLAREAQANSEPTLTASVVLKSTGRCPREFKREFGVRDDEHERERLHRFWAAYRRQRSRGKRQSDSLAERSAKFSLVETRPHQEAFRLKVFTACGGACVISGCQVLEALDAAHRIGRNWRLGHNEGGDGYLLRKDLHALYDAGLLTISPKGDVKLHPSVVDHYASLAGATVRLLADQG